MSESRNAFNSGSYTGYKDLLEFFNRKRKDTPKGVSLKVERSKYLLLQFKFPDTGKRSSKACNCDFTEVGIIKAVEASWKVREALDTLQTASEFWSWYDKEILGTNEIENNLRTYQEIFDEIEKEYFKGRNKNTKRKRSKECKSDVASFQSSYVRFFNKVAKPNEYPLWSSIKEALFSYEQGTKLFKDAYFVLKKVGSKSANAKALLERLNDVDYHQTEFTQKQSISLSSYLNWYDETERQITLINNSQHSIAKQSWLWVSAMCVLYGLRPSEVAASANLTNSVTVDNVHFKAINDPSNKELLLVLNDFTCYGFSIKTGSRICKPMSSDEVLIQRLKIQQPMLPKLETKLPSGFSRKFGSWLKNNSCPVTQAYAFRHLANQLGEQYGIPQEIRTRMMGHSVAVNDSVYKKRSNTQTTVDLLMNHSKQPLSLDLAKQALMNNGFDIETKEVKAILSIIYQLE
jgi:hypothetical protein